MPDALIRCPSCDHELRVPPELLGRAVECPQCGSRFTSPPAGQAPIVPATIETPVREMHAEDPDGRAFRVSAAVRPPAILLIVACVLGMLWNGLWVMVGREANANPAHFRQILKDEMDKQNNDLPAEERARMVELFFNYLSKMPMVCGGLLIGNLIVLIGAIQMLRMRGYGLAVLGSVFALNPINVPCCLLHAPFGLWALIVLLNQEVRAAFR